MCTCTYCIIKVLKIILIRESEKKKKKKKKKERKNSNFTSKVMHHHHQRLLPNFLFFLFRFGFNSTVKQSTIWAIWNIKVDINISSIFQPLDSLVYYIIFSFSTTLFLLPPTKDILNLISRVAKTNKDLPNFSGLHSFQNKNKR